MLKILQKANNPKGSWLSRTEAKTKYYIYSIAHELLQCQINLPLFYNILLLIEAGQFLWYAIHPDYSFLWQTTLSQYPRDIVKFFQADALLREGDTGTYYALLYLMLGIQVAMLLCLIVIFSLFEKAKKKSSTVLFFALRLFSFYSQLLITIGPLPLCQVFLTAIICKDNDPLRSGVACYTGAPLANMVAGIIGLIILLVFSVPCQLFIIDMNPSSSVPFAAPQSNLGMIKLLVKLTLPIYVILDSTFEHANVFVVFYCVFFLLVLIMRYNSQGYYDSVVTICAIVMESLLFWAALVATLHASVDESDVDDTGLYYFLFVSPFACFSYYKIFSYGGHRLLKSNTKKFKKAIEFEKYINLVLQHVETLEEPEHRIELEGILRCHVKYCKSEDCPCHHMAIEISKDGEEGVAESKEMWFQFIKKTFTESMTVFSKDSRLHLQSAYFQHEKLHNKYKSLYELVLTEETRPNLQEEFCVFRYRNIVEKEMIEDDIRNTDSRVVDVNSIVTFQEKLVALQGEIGKAVNMQLDFWRELEQTNPNVLKLLSLGSRITVQSDIVKTSYSKLSGLNPNHIRMLKLYGNFLKDIMHDKFEAVRVLENVEYAERSVSVDKNFMDNERMKYSENSKTCIITCSGNLHSMGKILSANNETLDVLQYLHTEMIGQNISFAMPSILGDIHDDLMKQYFETNVARVMGRERLIFPTTKHGYIVPCTLMIKVFPNLDEGLRVVGFLKRADWRSSEESHHRTHYVLYGNEDNQIFGVSENCYESFGIPAKLTNGDATDFTISSLFPDLLNQNMEELKSTTGLVCTIDTSALEQNFLVGRYDSEEEINEEEETKQKRYRASKVRAILLLDDLFLGKHSVKVLKFIEVSDESRVIKSDAIATEDQAQQRKRLSGDGEATGSQNTDVDLDAKSEGSSVSVSSAIGEDSRQLKDMKAKISEKTLPSSISALQKITIVLAIALLIITAIQIAKRDSMKSELSSGLDGITISYERCYLQASINTEARLLELLSRNMISATTNSYNAQTYIKSDLIDDLQEVNSIQFQLGQYVLTDLQSGVNYTGVVQIENMLIDGTTTTNTITTPNAMYQYISSGQKIYENDISAFLAPIGPDSLIIPFYYMDRNGLSFLRKNIEDRADLFVEYYYQRTHDFSSFDMVTMILGVVFVIASLAFIIPKIFSVNKTNIKVLSLFGYIPPPEVSELAEKCELFMETYLDELTAKREESYFESEEEELEKSVQQTDNNNKKFKKRISNLGESQDESMQNYTLQMKEFPDKEDISQRLKSPSSPMNQLLAPDQESVMPLNNSRSEQEKSLSSPTNAQDSKFNTPEIKKEEVSDNKGNDKEKEKGKEEEEDDEQLYLLQERSKKLENSKDNNKGIIIVQITLFGFLFLAYFVGDFIHEEIYLNNYRKGIEHIKIICKRNPYLKYTLLFTLEELALNSLTQVYPDLPSSTVATDNYRIQYSDQVYELQAEIKAALQESFPSAFNDYFTLLLSYNNGPVCTLYYTDDPTGLALCQSFNGDVGLIQNEVTLVGNTESLMTNFYSIASRGTSDQIAALASQTYNTTSNIMNAIDPIIESLVTVYASAFNNYMDEIYLIQRIKFIGFIVGSIIIILFVWLPYLRRLMRQIFRTKGLLNMIPMDMLKKNKSLRETFTSNEILNAVR